MDAFIAVIYFVVGVLTTLYLEHIIWPMAKEWWGEERARQQIKKHKARRCEVSCFHKPDVHDCPQCVNHVGFECGWEDDSSRMVH